MFNYAYVECMMHMQDLLEIYRTDLRHIYLIKHILYKRACIYKQKAEIYNLHLQMNRKTVNKIIGLSIKE